MSLLTLSEDIQHSYNRLVKLVNQISLSDRKLKVFDGTGGKVSVSDIVAYQIGWGKCLIRWYKTGIQGKMPEMPGDGFSTWNYVGIAHHFYQMYQFDNGEEQMRVFHQVVLQILEIVKIEEQTGYLEQIGVWPWCTLLSGKRWPLSKWIRVNTASPYQRATRLIKK